MTTPINESQASCNLDRGATETRCVEASEERERHAFAERILDECAKLMCGAKTRPVAEAADCFHVGRFVELAADLLAARDRERDGKVRKAAYGEAELDLAIMAKRAEEAEALLRDSFELRSHAKMSGPQYYVVAHGSSERVKEWLMTDRARGVAKEE